MAPSTEERIEELEAKVRELEALTRGLTDEMLDLKSIVMKLSARAEDRRVPPPVRMPIATGQRETSGLEKGSDKNLVPIMQSDGTLKPEPRTNESLIIASGRYMPKGSKKAEERDGSPLIYATDDDGASDDAVVIKKKK
ncbi:MAG: hypothetical protein QHG99_05595 [Methanomicrobiales archaeon]|nr:hypothetical protein [Methanomicrobiales archaeon]